MATSTISTRPTSDTPSDSSGKSTNDAAWRQLQTAAKLFAIGTLIHAIDHFRRGQGSVSDLVFGLGSTAQVGQVVAITLVLVRHRIAPLLCAIVGFPIAIGIAVVHWTPNWGPWSDPVWSIHSLTGISYFASTVEIVGALSIAIFGLKATRVNHVPTARQGREKQPRR